MIRAKRQQIGKIVRATVGAFDDVMYVRNVSKSTHNATKIVTPPHSLANVGIAAAFPVLRVLAAVHAPFAGGTALVRAVIAATACKARVFEHVLAAVLAGDPNFVLPTSRSHRAVPFAITFILSAGYGLLRRPIFKSLATDRAYKSLFAAFIITVVSASVLMMIDVARLLARIFCDVKWFAAAAGAKYCSHKSIILAQ